MQHNYDVEKHPSQVKRSIGPYPWQATNLADAETAENFKDWARHERAMTPAQHEGAKFLADGILTLGEQMLVARVMPCMVFWELSCSAMGYAGHICNKVQNVEEIIDRLPRDPKKVPLLLLR